MSTSSAASRIQANVKDLFQANLAPGNAYVRFQLTSEITKSEELWEPSYLKALTGLFSIEQVEESLVVAAEQITSLPNMPEYVIGIMNSRDRVFCVFDLAQLLQLSTGLIAPRQYQIIVFEVSQIISAEQSLYIGLAVNHIQGITRLTSEKFQSPQDLPASLSPYVHSCVWETEQQLLVLDVKKIANNIVSSSDKQQ